MFAAKGNCKQRIECVLRIQAKSERMKLFLRLGVLLWIINEISAINFRIQVICAIFFPLFVRAQIRKVVKLFIRFISKVQQSFVWNVQNNKRQWRWTSDDSSSSVCFFSGLTISDYYQHLLIDTFWMNASNYQTICINSFVECLFLFLRNRKKFHRRINADVKKNNK